MATLVSTSPPAAAALSTRLSPTSSDESSLYELSFDYRKDEDGNVHRISKRRQPSILTSPILPAIHYESPVDVEPPPPLPSNIVSNNNNGGLQVPRRSSLSRSESAPGPNEWEHHREWKRAISTPVAYSSNGFSRPKSVQALSESNLHNKENEHAPLSSLQTPHEKLGAVRRQAPLPLRASRMNPSVPVTPSTSAPPQTYVRMSSTPTVPVPRRDGIVQSDLSLVNEVASPVIEVPVPGQLDEFRVALPPSPPQGGRPRGSSLSNGLSLVTSRIKRNPSDGSTTSPEDQDSYYSHPSTSSEANGAGPLPQIPVRSAARARLAASTPGLASSLTRGNSRARRVLLSEKKPVEIETLDDIDMPSGGEMASRENSPNGIRGFGHQRRDSQTILPSNHPSNVQQSNPEKLSPTYESAYARHRRSPTAPEPPTSSGALGGSREKASAAKTWGAAIGEEEEVEREGREEKVDSKEERKERANGSNGVVISAAGFGPGTRQFLVNKKSYIRLDLLGRGGSSRVYRVLTPNNELYALKRVSLDKASEEEIAGYRNEIILLRRLEGNKRIIRLIDAEMKGGPKGSLMMVMECGEIDLAHLLQQQQTHGADLVWIRCYWKQMLEAVQVIHEEKIVHSDLKPANFVLVKGALKLIDFGIANAISNDTTNIQRDHQIGTVNYMSPEAIELPEGMRRLKVGRSSDVWSLGCILYQMVYGQPPFAALSTLGKMKAIPDHSHQIDFPPETAPLLPVASDQNSPANRARDWSKKVQVPQVVIDTLRTCLNRNPKERSTIPDLLASPWLDDGAVMLQPHQGAIDAHLMKQALQYAIRYGKNDPEWLNTQSERLVAELIRLSRSPAQ